MDSVPQNQELSAFIETLYEQYKVPLFRVIQKHVGNSHVCEDVFHEVCIQLIRKATLLCELPRHKMEAYIFLVAHGVSCDFLRKKYRHAEVDLTEEIIENISESYLSTPDPMDTFSKIELSMMMEGISEEDRTLLIGKYYLELSVNELKEIVGGTSASIRSKIHRAKKKVFEQWRKSGLSLEDFLNG